MPKIALDPAILSKSTIVASMMALSISLLSNSAVFAQGATPREGAKLIEQRAKFDQKHVPMLHAQVSSWDTSREPSRRLKGSAAVEQMNAGSAVWDKGLRPGDEIVKIFRQKAEQAALDARTQNNLYRARLTRSSSQSQLQAQSFQQNVVPVQIPVVNIKPPPGYKPPDFHIAINRCGPDGKWYVFNPLDNNQREAAVKWGFEGVESQLKNLRYAGQP